MDFFYRGSPHAIKATKPEMLQHAEEIKSIIISSGSDIQLVAVNMYYKCHFIGKAEGRLYEYSVGPFRNEIRREYEFRGYGGDAWEQAPNYVQLKDIELGQMELF
ncbi:hypothetical protein ACFCW7_00050 [Paenibacillus glucanolyticus]|uniref:hypothetical protein n=1 Tax=Paenibacillus glucanolyticus TaxID=59843 RepID=UPI0035E08011